jgi:hypothetical protein
VPVSASAWVQRCSFRYAPSQDLILISLPRKQRYRLSALIAGHSWASCAHTETLVGGQCDLCGWNGPRSSKETNLDHHPSLLSPSSRNYHSFSLIRNNHAQQLRRRNVGECLTPDYHAFTVHRNVPRLIQSTWRSKQVVEEHCALSSARIRQKPVVPFLKPLAMRQWWSPNVNSFEPHAAPNRLWT